MKISTRGRYALRFMLYLGRHNNGSYIALKDVSEKEKISIKYLEQITALLSKFGLLISVRGPQGGYRLARNPENYTVADILRITEGSLAPVACLETPENICERKDQCPTLSMWEGLQKVVLDYLSAITLEDLLNKEVDVNSLNYMI